MSNRLNEKIKLVWWFKGGAVPTPSSCKYAGVPDIKGLGSPQDLSLTTSSSSSSALSHLAAAQNSLAGPPSTATVPVASSSSSSTSVTPSSKHHHDSSGKSSKGQQQSQQRNNHHHHSSNKNATVAVGASSPSSVSSVSSGSSDPHSPGQHDGDSKNPNAPQIYPWMKRVHLGQSEWFNFKFNFYVRRKKSERRQTGNSISRRPSWFGGRNQVITSGKGGWIGHDTPFWHHSPNGVYCRPVYHVPVCIDPLFSPHIQLVNGSSQEAILPIFFLAGLFNTIIEALISFFFYQVSTLEIIMMKILYYRRRTRMLRRIFRNWKRKRVVKRPTRKRGKKK